MDLRWIDPPGEGQGWLSGFDRTQAVTLVWRDVGGTRQLVACPYVEDWNCAERAHIEAELAQTLAGGGGVLTARDEMRALQGFAALSAEPLASQPVPTLQLLEMHVARPARGKGLGRQLLLLVSARARLMGARALYISACSSAETIGFYRAMGCVDAPSPDPALAAAEPCDVQLIRLLQ